MIYDRTGEFPTRRSLNIVHKNAFRMPRRSRQLDNRRCSIEHLDRVPFDPIFLRPPPLLVFERTTLKRESIIVSLFNLEDEF